MAIIGRNESASAASVKAGYSARRPELALESLRLLSLANHVHAMLPAATLAAHSTTLHKLSRIPTSTWVSLALFAIAVFLVVRVWRTLKAVNDYAPYLACAVVSSAVFFYWVYSRTEPAFLTPVVERLTPFFPTRDTQQQNIERARTSRDS